MQKTRKKKNNSKAQQLIDPQRSKLYTATLQQIGEAIKRSELAKAQQLITEIQLKDRNNPDALARTAEIYCIQAKYEYAQSLLNSLLLDYPGNPMLQLLLVQTELGQQQLSDAKQRLFTILPALSNHVEEALLAAQLLEQLGEIHSAIELLERILGDSPTNTACINGLAQLLMFIGEQEKAQALFKKLVQLQPKNMAAIRLYTISNKVPADDPILSKALKLWQQPAAPRDRAQLGFALGKAFQDRGDLRQAFEYYLQANRAYRQCINFNNNDIRIHFDTLKQYLHPDKLKFRAQPDTQLKPIFIIGMPRSGSTLVEQILSSHSEVHGAGETKLFYQLVQQQHRIWQKPFPIGVERYQQKHFQQLADGYRQQIHNPDSKTIIVDKGLHNFYYLGLITHCFPNAKIIHCQRDPLDTCLSIFTNFFSEGGHGYAYQLDELGSYFKLYQDLMMHWQKHFGASFLNLNYEELAANPGQHIRLLLESCELPFEQNCIDFHQQQRRSVKTMSNTQVNQPINSNRINRWHSCEDLYQPLAEALQEQ